LFFYKSEIVCPTDTRSTVRLSLVGVVTEEVDDFGFVEVEDKTVLVLPFIIKLANNQK
jgi:hypothetical protein